MTGLTEVQLVLLAGGIGIMGAVIGGASEAIGNYLLQRLWEKKELVRSVLEWANRGRTDNFRHVDLRKADLRGVDLGAEKPEGQGADLSYANLRKADLRDAHLRGTDLRGADLQDTKLRGAKHDDHTNWPCGFDPEAAGAICEKRWHGVGI